MFILSREVDAMGFARKIMMRSENGALRREEGQLTRLQIGDRNQFFRTHGITEIHCGEKTSAFTRCLTEKLLTYGVGRGMEYYDRAAIEKIAREISDKEKGLEDLIVEVVASVPFTFAGQSSPTEPNN